MSVYGEKVYDSDGRQLAVGAEVLAGDARGTVTAIGEADVDWSDEQERAVLVSWPVVTARFANGETETFPVSHQQPRWMYDDEMRFVAEDLRDPPRRDPNEWQALIDLADEATPNLSKSKELG